MTDLCIGMDFSGWVKLPMERRSNKQATNVWILRYFPDILWKFRALFGLVSYNDSLLDGFWRNWNFCPWTSSGSFAEHGGESCHNDSNTMGTEGCWWVATLQKLETWSMEGWDLLDLNWGSSKKMLGFTKYKKTLWEFVANKNDFV